MTRDLVLLPVTRQMLHQEQRVVAAVPMIFIQHLKMDTVSFLHLWQQAGGRVDSCIAIPYSWNDDALAYANDLGLSVQVPTLDKFPRAIAEAVRSLEERDERYVIQDVGGHFADLLQTASLPRGLLGIIEETKQGLWRYQGHSHPGLAVVQIADSPLKMIEAGYVGRSITTTVAELLRAGGRAIHGQTVAVIGYGDIGRGCALALRNIGCEVRVTEVSSVRAVAAVGDGFRILNPTQAMAQCRIVVGCTGSSSLQPSDFHGLEGEFFLFSGSSRQVEFAAMLESATIDRDYPLRGRYADIPVRTVTVDNARIHIVHEGFPVNFVHESLPDAIIDLVFAQLVAATTQLIAQPQPGISRLSDAVMGQVARQWLEEHAHSSGPGEIAR